MRVPFIAATSAAVSALILAGCGQHGFKITRDDEKEGPLRVVTQLECPEHQGVLTRVRTSADGLGCEYAGPRGSKVSLQLIRLKSGETTDSVLQPIEQQLAALMPGALTRLAKADADGAKADSEAAKAQAEAERAQAVADRAAERAQEAADKATERAEDAADRAANASDDDEDDGDARASASASASTRHGGDNTDVNMPGLSVKTRDDRSTVRLPGIRIDANDQGAHINIGGVHIDADDRGKTHGSGNVSIRSDKGDVSIRAQDHAAEVRSRKSGDGLRATYILADDEAPASAWRLVGYEARGPAVGPIVVAVVKSKYRHEDPVFSAAKALVKRNVGG